MIALWYDGSMKWAVAVALVSACANARPMSPPPLPAVAPAPDRVVGWPSPLPERTWKIGQWVQYRAETRDRTERVAVVGQGLCGTWIEWTVFHAGTWAHWEVCFDDKGAPGPTTYVMSAGFRITDDLRTPRRSFSTRLRAEIETRLRPLLEPPPQFAEEHQAIAVPAGRFDDSVRAVASTATWFHPAVPLGGLVTDGSRSLVGFGSSIDDIPLWDDRDAPAPRGRYRNFVSLGVGSGRLTGHGAEAAANGTALALTLGVPITRTLDLVAQGGGTTSLAYSPDPTKRTESAHLLLGVRWMPIAAAKEPERPRFDPRALYLQAGAGLAMLSRSADEREQGLGLGASVGWLPIHGWDWAIGFEGTETLGLFGAGAGTRHDLSIVVGMHIVMR